MSWLWKRLWTMFTSKSILHWMSSYVFLQISWLRKYFWHCSQVKIFSSVWVILSFHWCLDYEKDFGHCSQVKVFSTVWVLMGFFRCPDHENAFGHCWQVNVFSQYEFLCVSSDILTKKNIWLVNYAVCILICFFRYPGYERWLWVTMKMFLDIVDK